MTFPVDVPVFDGVDWWWGRSLFQALFFMRDNRPRVLVLEWWTATTFHTYFVLAIAARLLGVRVVLEMHETQDPGEANFVLMRKYGRWGLGLLIRIAHGAVVHSKVDYRWLEERYNFANLRVAIAPLGPFDQYHISANEGSIDDVAISAVREAPRPSCRKSSFFRPYTSVQRT